MSYFFIYKSILFCSATVSNWLCRIVLFSSTWLTNSTLISLRIANSLLMPRSLSHREGGENENIKDAFQTLSKRILIRPKNRFVTLLIDKNSHLSSCYKLSETKLTFSVNRQQTTPERIVGAIKNVWRTQSGLHVV